jgi:hypothetical protein
MSFTCEVRIRGRLTPAVRSEFQQLAQLTEVEHVETVLYGPIEDQAALHGLLRLIEALCLEVTELHRFPPLGVNPPGPGEQPR